MNHTLKEFEEALAKDKELQEAFDENCKKQKMMVKFW